MTFHSRLLVELEQIALVSVKYSNSEKQITPLPIPRMCQFKPFGLNPRDKGMFHFNYSLGTIYTFSNVYMSGLMENTDPNEVSGYKSYLSVIRWP